MLVGHWTLLLCLIAPFMVLWLQRVFKQQQVSKLWQQFDEYTTLKQENAAGVAKASDRGCSFELL